MEKNICHRPREQKPQDHMCDSYSSTVRTFIQMTFRSSLIQFTPVWLPVSGGGYWLFAAPAAKSLQSCPTLCDPIDGSPRGSPVPGTLQAISFSNAGKWKVKVKSLSRVRLLATPWTAAYQAPPSIGFSRQEYWSGLPLPSLNSHIHTWPLEKP